MNECNRLIVILTLKIFVILHDRAFDELQVTCRTNFVIEMDG
jgi:hypothetical protein